MTDYYDMKKPLGNGLLGAKCVVLEWKLMPKTTYCSIAHLFPLHFLHIEL